MSQLSYHAGLLGASEATLGILCPVLETPVHEVCGETGEAPREDYHSSGTMCYHVLLGLEHMSCEEWLKELGLFSEVSRTAMENVIALCK